jgi:hypothetical protein
MSLDVHVLMTMDFRREIIMREFVFVLVILSYIILFSGCAAINTGIVQIADDTYMYGKQDWQEYSGSVIKAGLYQEANAFCAKKGKKFVPITSTHQDYGFQWASAEIQFTCK